MKHPEGVIAPLISTHAFQGSPDDFYCADCHKPRAVHEHTGFSPIPTPTRVVMDESFKYGSISPSNTRMGFKN